MKLQKMQILLEMWGPGVKMFLMSQFFIYDGRVDTKCSEGHSAVRDQWSGVRGKQSGSGVKTEVKYQDLESF